MMDNIIAKIIVALIFVGYTGYTTYKSIKLFVDYKKAYGEFKIAHKNAEFYSDGILFTVLSAILSGFSLFMTFFSYTHPANNGQEFYYCMAYFCIAIIFIGLAFETYVRKRAYFIEDGMFYVDKIYRYKMMMKFEEKGILIKNIRVLMAGGETLGMSKKMAILVSDKKDARKKLKKERKK